MGVEMNCSKGMRFYGNFGESGITSNIELNTKLYSSTVCS